MTGYREFAIPKLATVVVDTRIPRQPLVRIVMDPAYVGELTDTHPCGPDDLYLECDHASAVDNEKLAAFMEVAYHWDWDGDGKYDADEMVKAVEDALYLSEETPDAFRPPLGWFTGTLMWFMPPSPDRHVSFGFGKLQERYKWTDWLWAVPALVAFVLLMKVQVHFLPWMQYSVVSGYLAGANALGMSAVTTWIVLVAGIILLNRRRKRASRRVVHTYGFFSKAAVYEEQAFREGSENWTFRQRVTSCVVFGAIHMVNLIYPLATILPLALGGGLLMWCYLRSLRRTPFRRTAVLAAAVKHRLYNKVVLTAIVVVVIAGLGFGLYDALLIALTGLGLVVRDMVALRKLARRAIEHLEGAAARR